MKLQKRLKTLALAACAALALVTPPAHGQLLWKVEKPGSDKVSYLLGTHHFAPVEILDSIAGLDKALESVDKLYGEIDMSLMTNPAELMKYQGLLIAPADSTLDKILSPAELDSVNVVWNRVTKGQMPLSMMYGMKPASVSNSMVVALMAERFPDKDMTKPGMDQTMQDRARQLGKEVAGLESMEFQMNMLFGSPISKQKKDLMEAVSNGGNTNIDRALMITEAYMSRDLDIVENMMTDPDIIPAQEAERMIFGRNDSWVAILADEMTQRPLMVVVGAGHLPAGRGVIAQLRKAGYTVTPVD